MNAETVVHVEGDVLEGKTTAREALLGREAATSGERYGRVEDYDPVLRAHCRLEPVPGRRLPSAADRT